MKLFLFALFVAGAVAGPGEETVDNILTSFIKNNGGKDVDTSGFSYTYVLTLGIFSTTIDAGFTNGQLNLNSFTRTSPVDSAYSLAFNAEIGAKLSFTYDFRAVVPAPWSLGTAHIDWKAPVFMNVTVDANKKASLETISLLPTGTLVADAVPYVPGRTATLYPQGDNTFATALFTSLQGYLRREFKNIPF